MSKFCAYLANGQNERFVDFVDFVVFVFVDKGTFAGS